MCEAPEAFRSLRISAKGSCVQDVKPGKVRLVIFRHQRQEGQSLLSPVISDMDLEFALLGFSLFFYPIFPHYAPIILFWNGNIYSLTFYVGRNLHLDFIEVAIKG